MSLEFVGLLIHMASSRASCAALAASGCIADGEEEEEADDDEEDGRTLLLECAATTTRRKEAAIRGDMASRCCLCEVVGVGVKVGLVNEGWAASKTGDDMPTSS